MEQELDLDELEAVAGGEVCDDNDPDKDNCTQQLRRCLDTKGCAATVGTKNKSISPGIYINSTCSLNDGCEYNAVIYVNTQGKMYDRGDTIDIK